jgi:hypothetical protein
VRTPHGFVEEVRYASRCDRPDVIAVRVGLLGRLLLILPVGEVAEIIPSEERIILHRSPRPTATERLQDWRERVQPAPCAEAQTARSKPSQPELSASKLKGRWRP